MKMRSEWNIYLDFFFDSSPIFYFILDRPWIETIKHVHANFNDIHESLSMKDILILSFDNLKRVDCVVFSTDIL